MYAVTRWAAICGAALAFNIAALAGASALTLPKVPLKPDAAPQVVDIRHGGGVSGGPVIRRMGGGGHGYSRGGQMPRIHSGGYGGNRAIRSGGHGGYRVGNRGRDYAVRSGNIRRYPNYNRNQWNNERRYQVRNAERRHYGGGKYTRHNNNYNRHYNNRHYDPRHHGHRYKHKHNNYNYYHDGWWYAWPWWTVGVGIGIGNYWGNYWDVPVYEGYDEHVAWCLRRYRSYDPASDTYLGYDGRYHRCISPYIY